LRQHFTALDDNATEAENTARKFMENATGETIPQDVAALGAAAVGANAVALNLLKYGFAGVVPKYYKAGDKAKLPQSLVDAGMKCKILGPPPVADTDLMKLMDLQKNVGQYLIGSDAQVPGTFTPFEAGWEIDPAGAMQDGKNAFYPTEAFREWGTGTSRRFGKSITSRAAARARDKMETGLEKSQPVATLTAAKQLNAFLNNQSLVVLFTFRGKNLLFVGDAQAGNWEHWLFGTDVPDKTGRGTIAPMAQQILSRIDFYKVGHHGSGNATPKVAADIMGRQGQKFIAYCSTQADVYGEENPADDTKGSEVPRRPLLAQLAREGVLVRSDQIPIAVGVKKPKVNIALPKPPAGTRLEKGAVWVDCYL
jgi:hypothetical protein